MSGLRRFIKSPVTSGFAGSNKFNSIKNFEGVYLSSKRGGPPWIILFIRYIFKRAYNVFLQHNLTGGGEFSTRQRSVVES